MHSEDDLRCIQCHVNPLILDAPNQNNRLAFPFVGRIYGRRLADFLLRQTTNKRDGETDPSG